MLRGVELDKQHDENAMIWQLLELLATNLMVL